MFRNSKKHYDSKVDKTDSVIYFNANIYNDPVTNNQKVKLARFVQSISSGSIVDLPENYYMAIVRFAISHALIPIYQFKDNFYSVTLRIGLNPPVQKPLVYLGVGNYSDYGYTNPVFYYNQVVSMINTAMRSAYVDLGVAANLQSFIAYDELTERFTMYFNENDPTNIFFNSNLYQQFQLFPAQFDGFNQPNGMDYTFSTAMLIKPNNLNLEVINGINFYKLTQERSALYLLNEVQSIVFTSTTLNVTKEYTGRNDGSGNVGSISILADFVPDQSSGRDLSEYQYNVQGPPRLVNLTNTIPMTDIDYQVGIRFRDGTIVPLYLEPGETCEVKFGFFKKSLYDNNFEY